jgi:hypothetical protein
LCVDALLAELPEVLAIQSAQPPQIGVGSPA